MDKEFAVFNPKILVVSPHPDDETIGCGGVILKYAPNCDVVLLTDGSKGISPRWNKDTIVDKRAEEFAQAMNILRVNQVIKINIPDKSVKKAYRTIKREINLRQYDYILVPNKNEKHIDHKYAYRHIKKLFHHQHAKGKLVEYEVWTPLRTINCSIDITDVFDSKKLAICSYTSQLDIYNYSAMCEGLSLYRGACSKVKYAESFYIHHKHEFLKRIYHFLRFGEKL